MNPLLLIGGGILALAGLVSLAGKKKGTAAAKRETAAAEETAPRQTRAPTSTLHEIPVTARTMIRRGMKGPDVVVWQRVVGQSQDGIFGPDTDGATRAFQREHGLDVDGIVGPKTWAVAYSMYR